MNIIDEKFVDASIYSVNFYCNKNKKEYEREILIPYGWDENQSRSTILKIFNDDIVIRRVDLLMDIWIPKSIKFFPND